MSMLTALSPQQSQRSYRVLLAALAEPGTVHRLSGPDPILAGPLTLADYTAPLAALTADAQPTVEEVARVTGSTVTPPERARLALALSEPSPAQLARLHVGTPLAPHTATLLFQRVPDLDTGTALRLSGPGVPGNRTMTVPVGHGFVDKRNELCRYPLGFDVFFVADDGRVAGVPRSSRIEVQR